MPYCLNAKFVTIPYAKNYEEFYDNVKKENVDYIFINYSEARSLEPEISNKLLNFNAKGLVPIVSISNPRAIIYKVIK